MAQQIKKKFLSPEVIDYFDGQIDLVEQGLSQELLDRASGDAQTLTDANAYTDSKVLEESGLRETADLALDGRITTLEEQVGDDLQEAISDLEAAIAAEALARENADTNLQGQIDTEKGRIDAILLASDADKDSFKEIVDLINSVDTENDQAFAGYVLSNDAALAQEVLDRQAGDLSTLEAAKDYTDLKISEIPSVDLTNYYTREEVDAKESALDERIDAVEADKEIIEVESIGDAPEIGLVGKVYVAKDSNKLYRWATVGGGELSFDLVVGSGETHTTLESAIAASVDGQNILVKSGTYLVSSTILVNKQVKIVGEDKELVIFETASTTSAPVSMFNVSVDNVALAKMTIKHKKTSNTSVETAVVASGGGFPQTRISNFIMESCNIEFIEFGMTVRAENWCVRDSQFAYATGSVSNSCRAIGIYGTKGNAFIKDNFLKNDILNGTAFRPFYLTSTTGTNPNETVEGKLVLEGTTHVGPLAQFWNQDNQQGSPGSFELQIKNNITNESNLFAGFAAAVANSGDMFSSITLSGNTLSNLHAVDGGKGVFGVYGSAAFRSSSLVVHASSNTLGQSVYRTGWEAVEGTTVGKEVTTPAFTVSVDSAIPESGDAPNVSPSGTSEYVELSPSADLSEIESDIDSLDSRLDVLEAQVDGPNFSNGSVVVGEELSYIDLDREYLKLMSCSVGRLMVHQGEDFTVSVVEGKTRLTWIGSLVNPGGTEAIETGDKVFFVGAY
jgi:hypothetical protein